ncbi:Inosine/uridine-preferring nucleoside hydrolase domain-containing protein [Dipodascopsis uninucleata]
MRKLIIDCDPGIDDMLALLMALNASNIDLALISVCFGNVAPDISIKNVLSLFRVLQAEKKFRYENGIDQLPWAANSHKPIVAMGAKLPISDRRNPDADFFHGVDGLAGVSETIPGFNAPPSYVLPFIPEEELSDDEKVVRSQVISECVDYTPTSDPSWRIILDILRKEPENTVTIVAIAPMTNLARAALEDPVTFSRVREIVAMGGNIDYPGNMSVFGEFNFYADVDAAAVVCSTTSRTPASTLPPGCALAATVFERPGVRPVEMVLFPLDITMRHRLRRTWFDEYCEHWLNQAGNESSPLVQWTKHWVDVTFDTFDRIVAENSNKQRSPNSDQEDGTTGSYMELHDPLAFYYAILDENERSSLFTVQKYVDMRIETVGQWTWGMCVIDRRHAPKRGPQEPAAPRDIGDWLSTETGNRVSIATGGPGSQNFSRMLLDSVFGEIVKS